MLKTDTSWTVDALAAPDRSISRAIWLSSGKNRNLLISSSFQPYGAILFETEVDGTHRIQVCDIPPQQKGTKLVSTQKHSDRAASVARLGPESKDFAKNCPVEVTFLRSDFDDPPAVFNFTYDFKSEIKPQKIDCFNDSLVSQWKLGKVEYGDVQGRRRRGRADVDRLSARISTPRKNGRWCRWSTAARTAASPPTSVFAGTCNCGRRKGYVVGLRQLSRLQRLRPEIRRLDHRRLWAPNR